MQRIVSNTMKGLSSRPILAGLLAALLVVAVLVAIRWPTSRLAHRNPLLEDMRPNAWVKIFESTRAGWQRQAHAGLAFDSSRGSLLLFGSDTHGEDWDNSVHEFDPIRREWTTHYPQSASRTYRVDEEGLPVAGEDGRFPWAMHTFDGVVYDPSLDSLVVVAKPEHNPMAKQLSRELAEVTWIYSLSVRQWVPLSAGDATSHPKFFGAATAYDEARDVVVAYGGGVFELRPERDAWRKATGENHHDIHKTMVYDSWRNSLAVFGDYRGTSDVWIYAPDADPGRPGAWERRVPSGDEAPPGSNVPVAFDTEHGVFLLALEAPDDADAPQGAWTFLYDPDANRYQRLREADLPPLGMNYMLAYDPYRKVFLLVTGKFHEPLRVWALRLDPTALLP